MLVLLREVGESIMIGDDIEVFLTEIKTTQKAKIGIKAPGDVSVHRKEVYEAIQRENLKAGVGS